MEPNPNCAPQAAEDQSWAVWRIDDNGNVFLVQDGLSKANADRLVEQYTARGHKQTYWAEKRQQA